MKIVRSILSKNIKFYRSRRGWSQAELAEKAHISTNYVSDIETCKKWPYPETLENLAGSLNIDVFELFKPELPDEHPALDALSQYNDDAKLLITKSLSDLTKSLDTMLAKY